MASDSGSSRAASGGDFCRRITTIASAITNPRATSRALRFRRRMRLRNAEGKHLAIAVQAGRTRRRSRRQDPVLTYDDVVGNVEGVHALCDFLRGEVDGVAVAASTAMNHSTGVDADLAAV